MKFYLNLGSELIKWAVSIGVNLGVGILLPSISHQKCNEVRNDYHQVTTLKKKNNNNNT